MNVISVFAVWVILTVVAIVVLIGPRAFRRGVISGGFSERRLLVVGLGYLIAVVVAFVHFLRSRN